MGFYLLNILFLVFSSLCYGQEPSTSPTPLESASPKNPRTKTFGSSLKKREKQKNDSSKVTENRDNTEDEIIKVKTDLIVSDVLVIDQKGNIIIGLKKKDFLVSEDGVSQEIGIFSFGEGAEIPRSIVLIIDYSGSQTPYIKNSIEGAKKLVDKLAVKDRMAIVTDDVQLLVDFTRDKELLKKELDNLEKKVQSKKSGRSEQYTALVATLQEMFDEEDIRPIVILQSDGDELFALKRTETDKDLPPVYRGLAFGIPLKNFSFADVYALVGRSRAIIYSIIPGFRLIGLSQEERVAKTQDTNAEESNDKKLLKEMTNLSNWFLKGQLGLLEISKLSGGYTDFIEKPEDAENVYSDLFTIINNRYVIGYYLTDEDRKGKRRTVKIEVKGHPEFIVTGRKSYFTPALGK